jgi:hypothetical protein
MWEIINSGIPSQPHDHASHHHPNRKGPKLTHKLLTAGNWNIIGTINKDQILANVSELLCHAYISLLLYLTLPIFHCY